MEYIGLLRYCSSYSLTNINNLNNFLYMIMIKLNDEQKKLFVTEMKLIMGNSFTTQFKSYLFSKLSSSDNIFSYF